VGDDRHSRTSRTTGTLHAAHHRVEGKDTVRVPIKTDRDIIHARQKGKELAFKLGFSNTDLTLIATSISELARNIVLYANTGEITLKAVQQGERRGLSVVATDEGRGIPDIQRALQDGFSTSHSLGLGLPGVRRLMDEFEISSEVNRGTTVSVKKWVP
jgi:serine/threonine-protein kinase RsbT